MLACALATISLADGGGDEYGSSGGGSSTIGGATPAAHNTTIDLSIAAAAGNDARAANGFSSQPYCEVFVKVFKRASKVGHALQAYFCQRDKVALNVSMVGGKPPSFIVLNNNAGNPITDVMVAAAKCTVTFNGTASFPANSGTPGLRRLVRRGARRRTRPQHRHRPHIDTAVYRAGSRPRHRLHASRARGRPPLDRGARRGAARTQPVAASAAGRLGVEPMP